MKHSKCGGKYKAIRANRATTKLYKCQRCGYVLTRYRKKKGGTDREVK